ncbi:TIGR01777 family oxidoreductase [Halomonas sp. Bachu 37]|uniref:TIGR01777 family oxidoreductase n=1 Tax=Halomonas kashgarensis TaxID=3084920 RepID=UPI0032180E65
MRILITGGSGFVGRYLCRSLVEAGHRVMVVSRSPEKAQQQLPPECDIREDVLAFTDAAPEAIVNLAGEPIVAKRWSEEQKARLIESRVAITHDLVALCGHLHEQGRAPQVMISASAMGYYGAQGDNEVTEETPPHDEFAHRLCQRWEGAAEEVRPYGVRLVILRLGLVLDSGGGMLQKMLTPFKLGLGGKLGDGKQYMPWIHRHDLVRAVHFLLERSDLEGVFNAGAPHPVRNEEFTRTLSHQLKRPALFQVPAFVLETALGEMSRLLLTGAAMYPRRLEQEGFSFDYPTLDQALAQILRE